MSCKCSCGTHFKSMARLSNHLRDTKHNAPQWYKKEMAKQERERVAHPAEDMEPDWTSECEVCGASPVVPLTGMCGPCTFGEADTIDGGW